MSCFLAVIRLRVAVGFVVGVLADSVVLGALLLVSGLGQLLGQDGGFLLASEVVLLLGVRISSFSCFLAAFILWQDETGVLPCCVLG